MLPYPEGRHAPSYFCRGERGGRLATMVFGGPESAPLEVAVLDFQSVSHRDRLLDAAHQPNSRMPRERRISLPEYLGVGYVIGPRIAGTMLAGGVLSRLARVPATLSIWKGSSPSRSHHPSELRKQPGNGTTVPHLRDESGTTLERLHPLHRRRGRAGVGIITLARTIQRSSPRRKTGRRIFECSRIGARSHAPNAMFQ